VKPGHLSGHRNHRLMPWLYSLELNCHCIDPLIAGIAVLVSD